MTRSTFPLPRGAQVRHLIGSQRPVSDQGELDLFAVEFGSCLRGFSGLLLMQLLLGRNLRVQLAQALFDPRPLACNQLARPLVVHRVLPCFAGQDPASVTYARTPARRNG